METPIITKTKHKILRTRVCPKNDEKVTTPKKIKTSNTSSNIYATNIGVINTQIIFHDSTPIKNKVGRPKINKNINKRKVGGKKYEIIGLDELDSLIDPVIFF